MPVKNFISLATVRRGSTVMVSLLAFLTTFPTTFEATWTAAAQAESLRGVVCRAALCILAGPWLAVNCLHIRQADSDTDVLAADAETAIVFLFSIEPYDCLAKASRNSTEAPGRSCITTVRRWREDIEDRGRRGRDSEWRYSIHRRRLSKCRLVEGDLSVMRQHISLLLLTGEFFSSYVV